jgi:Zn-dependent protease
MAQPAFPSDGTTSLEPERKEPPRRSFGTATLAALAFAAAKFKGVLALLKFLPAGKVLITGVSMVAMVVVESWYTGWMFAVGFVLLILLHELGHGYAMQQSGVKAGWPVFIPFLGAMIAMKGTPQNRAVEAHIAFGGPLAGAAASLATAAAAMLLDSRLLMALAYSGFLLNLFNLTPMSPLDGGRITQAFSGRAWIVGLAIIGVLIYLTHAPQLYLIGFIGLMRIFRPGTDDQREVLPKNQQLAWAARYFGLSVFLAAGFFFSSRLLGRF